jgi:hypothetical protein
MAEVQDQTLPTKESTEQGVAADIPQPAEDMVDLDDEFCASSSVRHTLLLAQSQSNAMLKIVSSFEERLSWLEETMLPIDRCVRRRLSCCFPVRID